MQFKDATLKNEGKTLSRSFYSFIYMVIALFIENYSKYFNLWNEIFDDDKEMLNAWIEMAKRIDNYRK
jgi:hypothetical protein